MNKPSTGLIKALGLGALIVYGVGDILGAGIYTIIGKISGKAGELTWLSFAIAMGIVFFTALTYSELSSRYPKSGGVSIYTQKAFGKKWLSILAGLLLFCATILSMSTVSHAFVGYLVAFGYNGPPWLAATCFLLILLLINLRGIKQSSLANIISTSVEVSGLLMVLGFGFLYWFSAPEVIISEEIRPGILDVFQGASLAFFAFTGFEDLANVAEEVKKPEKNLPKAILSSIAISGFLYLCVSWIVTAIVPGSELSHSNAPLLSVLRASYPSFPSFIFTIIAIFAVSNTTLLNYITASRLLYGMSKARLIPNFFQSTHPRFHTPYIAILFIFPLVLGLNLSSSLIELASSTSTLVLVIFSFSNAALIKIKLEERKKNLVIHTFKIPLFVPFLAILLNSAAILFLPLSNIIPVLLFVLIVLLTTYFYKNEKRGQVFDKS